MKTCGIIGGMSWESTSEYYRLLNEGVKKALGKLHSAKVIIYSVDFEEIAVLQRNNEWEKSAEILSNAAKALQKAGSDFFLIATNTMHIVAHKVASSVNIKFLDIRDALISKINELGIKKVLLLGTKFTMKESFYKDYLIKKGIDVVVPKETEMDIIHSVIFNELCLGITKESSKKELLKIINSYDVEGVILGCTELGLIIDTCDKTILDTTKIHCEYALKEMLVNKKLTVS